METTTPGREGEGREGEGREGEEEGLGKEGDLQLSEYQNLQKTLR